MSTRSDRVASPVMRRCLGYQTDANGAIRASVWSGLMYCDNGKTRVVYWVNSGGAWRYLDAPPPIDRPIGELPHDG